MSTTPNKRKSLIPKPSNNLTSLNNSPTKPAKSTKIPVSPTKLNKLDDYFNEIESYLSNDLDVERLELKKINKMIDLTIDQLNNLNLSFKKLMSKKKNMLDLIIDYRNGLIFIKNSILVKNRKLNSNIEKKKENFSLKMEKLLLKFNENKKLFIKNLDNKDDRASNLIHFNNFDTRINNLIAEKLRLEEKLSLNMVNFDSKINFVNNANNNKLIELNDLNNLKINSLKTEINELVELINLNKLKVKIKLENESTNIEKNRLLLKLDNVKFEKETFRSTTFKNSVERYDKINDKYKIEHYKKLKIQNKIKQLKLTPRYYYLKEGQLENEFYKPLDFDYIEEANIFLLDSLNGVSFAFLSFNFQDLLIVESIFRNLSDLIKFNDNYKKFDFNIKIKSINSSEISILKNLPESVQLIEIQSTNKFSKLIRNSVIIFMPFANLIDFQLLKPIFINFQTFTIIKNTEFNKDNDNENIDKIDNTEYILNFLKDLKIPTFAQSFSLLNS